MHKLLANYIQDKIAISEEQLNVILNCFKVMYPAKNDLLVIQGELGNQMYFVNKGCVRIFFINELGQESTRFLAFENNFASALVSFITNDTSLEYVQALQDSELLYISRNDFFYLLENLPIWEKFYRYYLEFAYVTNTNRLMSFITMDARERYDDLLEKRPLIVKRLPNKIVASYLNISQETLSRIKSKSPYKSPDLRR